MKIIKTKTFKGMVNQIERLTKQILKQQNELKIKNDDLNQMSNDLVYFDSYVADLKKEIKNLKSLCAKSGLDYSHLYKNKEK